MLPKFDEQFQCVRLQAIDLQQNFSMMDNLKELQFSRWEEARVLGDAQSEEAGHHCAELLVKAQPEQDFCSHLGCLLRLCQYALVNLQPFSARRNALQSRLVLNCWLRQQRLLRFVEQVRDTSSALCEAVKKSLCRLCVDA